MLTSSIKAPIEKLITPLCIWLISKGISANMVTFAGTLLSVGTSLTLIPTGHLFAACILITIFVLFDLVDGTMARLSQKGANKWGALLDSTLDRISDGALLGALVWYLHKVNSTLEIVVLLNILTGFLISYIRARAEGLDIECNVGIAERTERLIVTLVAIGLAGLGVSFALAIGMWFLLLISIITISQRMRVVRKAL